MKRFRNQTGFTLIELIVVVGIIGVLTSISYVVIANRRQEAHRTTCLSNLRQCGIALRMYMDDWGAPIPPRYEVAAKLLPAGITECRMDHWQLSGPPMIGSYIYARGIEGWIECTDEQFVERFPRRIHQDYQLAPFWLVDVFHARDGRMPNPTQDQYLPLHGPRIGRSIAIPDPILVLMLDGHVRAVKTQPAGTRPDGSIYYNRFDWVGIVALNRPILPGSGCTQWDEQW